MVSYTNWKVGDVLNLCASVEDFCGLEIKSIYLNEVSVSKSPDICEVVPIISGDCLLHVNGIEVTFVTAKTIGTECADAKPSVVYKTIGSAITNNNGICNLSYTVSEQDKIDYESSGNNYKLLAYISNPDGQLTDPGRVGKCTENIIVGVGCLNCIEPVCLDGKLYESTCDTNGLCIADTTKLIADPCPSNYFDLIGTPWPWYDSNGAAQALTLKLSEITGKIINLFTAYGITDYTYITTKIFPKDNNVIIRVYLNELALSNLAAPLALVIPVILIAVGVIGIGIMSIFNYFWGTTDQGFTNGQFDAAGREFIKKLMDDCITITCSDISLTQDQKADCIINCNNSAIENWESFKEKLYPESDHADLTAVKTELQTCKDVYYASAKTSSDFQTLLDCAKVKRDTAVDKDGDKTLQTYPSDAAAGATKVTEIVENCWIKSPFGGCSLSANTGKKILIFGGLALVGIYVVKKSLDKTIDKTIK